MTTTTKKSIAAALGAVLFTVGLATAPTAASAKPFYKPGWGYHHGYWGHRHWNPGYVGIGLGLGALAAAAAASSAYAEDCYVVRRQFVDGFGNIYVRPVRVCN